MDFSNRLLLQLTVAAFALETAAALDDFPIVPDDIEVSLFASEPLVRNPCAITFDTAGRLCVGMGPQYRKPRAETPGDSVWILTDTDNDGQADSRHQFATGFNSIQGLAWRGSELFVANAPDLTVVSDTDGDGTADKYVRLYTDLGNLEHALHGLNFGPDGKLYMSKGNSKGLTQLPDQLAPQPFRELWGVTTPDGTPTFPTPVISDAGSYQNAYHDPKDDWGITGGVLRCNPDGSELEIVSRGFRNPWDITFDDTFNWLGTDNDQTMGDKIFAPFYGAHFGWGHPWSYDWKGDGHLPTAPANGPLFEGSGTGVIYCGLQNYPDHYRGVFLINDWLRREVYIYRPTWDGARRLPDSDRFQLLAHAGGGRAMPKSEGRSFDPVDIEIGPDGAIWISSWGRQYGAHYENGQLANAGRIYRLWPKSTPPTKTPRPGPLTALGSHLPVWRTDAQNELLKRGTSITPALTRILETPATSPALETWAIWTLGRIYPTAAWRTTNLNQHLQSIRIQATTSAPNPAVRTALTNPEPRIRLEAILTTRQTNQTAWATDIVDLLATEPDRIVYYAAWGALVDLLTVPALNNLLTDQRPAVRRAALLALLEQDALTDLQITPLAKDPDPQTAALATRRLGGKSRLEPKGRPLDATLPPPAPPAVLPFANITASTGHAYRTATLAPGAPVYTDRPYKIRNVPATLANAPFLQTANTDADAASGVTVTFDLKYPSTLYLADDTRAEAIPAWARQDWQPTDLTIETDDPKRMRLYRRESPAGPVTLGNNRDGVRARKGNYILVAVPKLLAPTGKAATLESSLAALPTADPSRGRDLFLSPRGANCAACHQLDGIGNHHAPDLSDIGNRTDANFLITSIINPSTDITEGFAAQMVTTKSGAAFTGILLEETGRHLTVAMTGGAKTKIARADITAQKTLPISAMPPGFNVMLSSQQVADIAAFLLTLKQPAPSDPGATFSFQRS
ncbi:MAG: c-type cytochrome, partial [Verrucomicrobiales bacterium]|nr:c-type cytochrome [Verrucomicrobiales bacterium]